MNNEIKHTPGPWEAEIWHSGLLPVVSESKCTVALVAGRDVDSRDANARLIAAAPDLLEALEDALCWLEAGDESDMEKAQELQAAIAKAKGESP